MDSDVSVLVGRQYMPMGKPLDPDYWKKWRASHPAYREREKARMRSRGPHSRGNVAAQYARERERLIRSHGDNGWTETRHPIMDAAELITLRYVRPDRRSLLMDPLYEEALMTAALALLEGQDPDEAVRCLVKGERALRWRSAPLREELLH